jgi:hypothetical protein
LCNRIQAARVHACVHALVRACVRACVPHDHRGVVDELRVPGICLPPPPRFPPSVSPEGPVLPYVCPGLVGFPYEQVAGACPADTRIFSFPVRDFRFPSARIIAAEARRLQRREPRGFLVRSSGLDCLIVRKVLSPY